MNTTIKTFIILAVAILSCFILSYDYLFFGELDFISWEWAIGVKSGEVFAWQILSILLLLFILFSYLVYKYGNVVLRGVSIIVIMLSIIWMAIIFYSDACVKLGVRDTTNKDDPDSITHDRYVCVYYSVITFTTVGYGDFVPSKDLRAVAATEALTGYFFLAMLMTCLSQVLNLFVANRTSEIIK